MTKKYNVFANVMLILVAANTIISFPLYIIGIFRAFGDMDLMTFESWYGDRMPLSYLSLCSALFYLLLN